LGQGHRFRKPRVRHALRPAIARLAERGRLFGTLLLRAAITRLVELFNRLNKPFEALDMEFKARAAMGTQARIFTPLVRGTAIAVHHG
jgi:hypothetical protein